MRRAPYLVGFFVALLLCVGGWVRRAAPPARKRSGGCASDSGSETTSLFGEAKTDGAAVTAELNSALQQDKGGASHSQVTALDLVEDISRAAPESKDGSPARLDVMELHIKPKKIDLKATAASAQYVEDFAAGLAKLSCVKGCRRARC